MIFLKMYRFERDLKDTFMSYFDAWGRTRAPIDPIYLSNIPTEEDLPEEDDDFARKL